METTQKEIRFVRKIHQTQDFIPCSILLLKDTEWIGHLYEIRQQMIAEHLFENTIYVVEG